ncbi:MAG TPA: adenylyltransferase/cytidyltransferase family protein, partial [Candidatus Omnitrophota bacterium]|nr:adenylyltransferase/cytidyltransferase family protein [Candidatus Omnitrophota bacterium]
MAKFVRKIGILGGSFNPIHCGHLFMARAAMEGLGLDKVIFVPANCSAHKTDREMAPAKDRLAMARIAVRGHKDFSVCDAEIKRGGISYTVDTARYF